MRHELILAKEAGAHGFVFGVLQDGGKIDEPANSALVELAAPLPCTFHRAFDRLWDQEAGLEQLIRCGFTRVLTSGGLGSAIENIDTLKALVDQAEERIIVMPGGGVRPENLEQLVAATGAAEYHSAAITDQSALPDRQAIADMKQSLADYGME